MKSLTLRISPELFARWQRVLSATNKKGIEVLADLVESWVATEEKKLLATKKKETKTDQEVAARVSSFFTKQS